LAEAIFAGTVWEYLVAVAYEAYPETVGTEARFLAECLNKAVGRIITTEKPVS
jgi:hypothetical protein